MTIAPAALASASQSPPPAALRATGLLLLLGVRADGPPSPEKLGIEQPTHQQLWHAAADLLASAAQRAWPTAAPLLARAADRLRLPLTDAARNQLEPLIERHLLPAAIGAAARLLATAAGWHVTTAGGSPDDLEAPSHDLSLALVAGPLPWSGFEVMTAAGMGWRIAVAAPVAHYLPHADEFHSLGGVESLRSAETLNKLLRRPGPERRAHIARTMEWVRARHLIEHRWRTLAAWPADPAVEDR